jgi:two-component system, NarL family, sensor kinase
MPATIRYYIIGLVIAFLALGLFIILLSALYDRRRRKHRKERFNMQQQFDKTLRNSQLEIKEQTLKYVSQELHDNLGQVASLIKINLNTLNLEDTEKSTRKIEDTKELTRQLITDIKSLSVSLGNDRLTQMSLSKAIETEVDRLNASGAFTAEFHQTGAMPPIDPGKEVILFRMVQEVLNNMIKHSKGCHFHILVEGRLDCIILELKDDGIGFDVAEKMGGGGAGLLNLRNRSALIAAQLSLESSPGNGTMVTIKLPI